MPLVLLKNIETNWLLTSSGIFYLRIILHMFMILHVSGFQDSGKDRESVKVVLSKDTPFYLLEVQYLLKILSTDKSSILSPW